jgi:acetyl esterase/lipase
MEQQLRQRIGEEPIKASPAHHVHPNAPPTIMFFGTDDRLLTGAQYMQQQMRAAGVRCELRTWDGLPHGFFNWGRYQNKPFQETLLATDTFLASLGYLHGPPTVEQYLAATAPTRRNDR